VQATVTLCLVVGFEKTTDEAVHESAFPMALPSRFYLGRLRHKRRQFYHWVDMLPLAGFVLERECRKLRPQIMLGLLTPLCIMFRLSQAFCFYPFYDYSVAFLWFGSI
jgi:hypothetical protein